MRFLVFSSQPAAQSAVDMIDASGRLIFAARGYMIVNGAVIGKRLSDGVPEPENTPTITWDIPRQRLDGKWVVSHPENQPGAATVIDANGTTAASVVMAGVVYDAIETHSDAWFAPPSPSPH